MPGYPCCCRITSTDVCPFCDTGTTKPYVAVTLPAMGDTVCDCTNLSGQTFVMETAGHTSQFCEWKKDSTIYMGVACGNVNYIFRYKFDKSLTTTNLYEEFHIFKGTFSPPFVLWRNTYGNSTTIDCSTSNTLPWVSQWNFTDCISTALNDVTISPQATS